MHAVLEINSHRFFGYDIKIKLLPELVEAFKATSSKMIHKSDFSEFKWKRSFLDYIIRNDKAY